MLLNYSSRVGQLDTVWPVNPKMSLCALQKEILLFEVLVIFIEVFGCVVSMVSSKLNWVLGSLVFIGFIFSDLSCYSSEFSVCMDPLLFLKF